MGRWRNWRDRCHAAGPRNRLQLVPKLYLKRSGLGKPVVKVELRVERVALRVLRPSFFVFTFLIDNQLFVRNPRLLGSSNPQQNINRLSLIDHRQKFPNRIALGISRHSGHSTSQHSRGSILPFQPSEPLNGIVHDQKTPYHNVLSTFLSGRTLALLNSRLFAARVACDRLRTSSVEVWQWHGRAFFAGRPGVFSRKGNHQIVIPKARCGLATSDRNL